MGAATVDEYMAALPADRRAVMEQLRETIRAAAPDATEVISYKMPAFKMDGRFLVSYDAYKNHYSLFPSTDRMMEALGDDLRPYLAGKGTIRFPANAPLPVGLVRKVVEIRVREHNEAS